MGAIDFSKDLYELTETNFGPKWAKFVFGCVLVLTVALSISGTVVAVGLIVTTVQPAIAKVPALPQNAWTPAAVSAVVTLGIIGVVGFWAYRRLRDWSRILSLAIDKVLAVRLEEANRRLERLEHNSATVASLDEAISNIHARVESIEPSFVHTIRDNALARVLAKPRVDPVVQPTSRFPFTLKWTRTGNCASISIENVTPMALEADVVLKALDRWSDKHVQYVSGDLPDGFLPGKLTGGSRLVRPEPVNPVSYNFITEVLSDAVRIQLHKVNGAELKSLPMRQRGKWRATFAVVLVDGSERDFYAPFDWSGKDGPTPDGEIRLAALQPHPDLKQDNVLVPES